MRKPWNAEEIEFLKANYHRLKLAKIAKALGRTSASVQGKARVMGVQYEAYRTPKYIPDLSEGRKGYVAGIIDGEGSLGVDFRGKKLRGRGIPTVQIANTNLELMRWLSDLLGVKTVHRIDLRGNRKPCYQMALCRKADVLHLLRQIHPYLHVKKKQAELLIELCMLRLDKRYRRDSKILRREKELIRSIRELNRKGKGGWKQREST